MRTFVAINVHAVSCHLFANNKVGPVFEGSWCHIILLRPVTDTCLGKSTDLTISFLSVS